MKNTDPEEEIQKGRIPLWLDPDDIKFLADEWRKIPSEVRDSHQNPWNKIAFRAMTALHKSGIEYTPSFPEEEHKYKL